MSSLYREGTLARKNTQIILIKCWPTIPVLSAIFPRAEKNFNGALNHATRRYLHNLSFHSGNCLGFAMTNPKSATARYYSQFRPSSDIYYYPAFDCIGLVTYESRIFSEKWFYDEGYDSDFGILYELNFHKVGRLCMCERWRYGSY